MRNARILIEYDGSPFHGWQIQPARPTIQGILTRILSRLDHRPVVVHGAGRTDAGVHAEGQVASFFFHRSMSEGELCRALNGNLPPEIRVRQVTFVPADFHARLSAKTKTYRYAFFLGSILSPFLYRYVYRCPFPLDLDRIRALAPLFQGEHDFAAFAVKPDGYGSTIRRVRDLSLRQKQEVIELQITADGFLRAMARRIAGTVQEVGRGRMTLEQVAELLQGRSGGSAGPSLPAKGLTLVRVDY